MKEEWVHIPGSNVEVSSLGRARNTVTGHELLVVIGRKENRLVVHAKVYGKFIDVDIINLLKENNVSFRGKIENFKRRSRAGFNESRKCHDCGAPTHNYRCDNCWRKMRHHDYTINEEFLFCD